MWLKIYIVELWKILKIKNKINLSWICWITHHLLCWQLAMCQLASGQRRVPSTEPSMQGSSVGHRWIFGQTVSECSTLPASDRSQQFGELLMFIVSPRGSRWWPGQHKQSFMPISVGSTETESPSHSFPLEVAVLGPLDFCCWRGQVVW